MEEFPRDWIDQRDGRVPTHLTYRSDVVFHSAPQETRGTLHIRRQGLGYAKCMNMKVYTPYYAEEIKLLNLICITGLLRWADRLLSGRAA